MKRTSLLLAETLPLVIAAYGCTLFGVDYKSTTTEQVRPPSVEDRIELLEQRVDRIEDKLKQIEESLRP